MKTRTIASVKRKKNSAKAKARAKANNAEATTTKTTPTFPCPLPGCPAVVNRKDHLKRHLATHSDQRKRFKCSFPGCYVTSFRTDVIRKHQNKHDWSKLDSKQNLSTLVDLFLAGSGADNRIIKRPSTKPESGAFVTSTDITDLVHLADYFDSSPPFSKQQTDINIDILNKLLYTIPSVRQNPDFTIENLKWFLKLYWKLFHPQFPVLHLPSFSTHQADNLLLLSMIMIGASFTNMVKAPEDIRVNNPLLLSDKIANSLFCLLSSFHESAETCKSWTFHCFLILEIYQLNRSPSKVLYERALALSFTKIKLLRQTILKYHNENSNEIPPDWESWKEYESMKRVAWATFYIDTMQATVYEHPLNLYVNQIKLALPCHEKIWESLNLENINSVPPTPKVSTALKGLLERKSYNLGYFSNKILLACLSNLILQMDQTNPNHSHLSLMVNLDENWRDTVSTALDFWKIQQQSKEFIGPRSYFPEYHSIRLHLRLCSSDYLIYAGVPEIFNSRMSPKHYLEVVNRMNNWIKSSNASICALHSLNLLFRVMLPFEKTRNASIFRKYDPSDDFLISGPKVILTSLLTLWCFVFSKYGPESKILVGESPESEDIKYSETAERYLKRVRFDLRKRSNFTPDFTTEPEERNMHTRALASKLNEVPGLNKVAGLFIMMAKIYRNSKSEELICYSILLEHCAKRSLGCPDIFCLDLLNDL